MPSARLTVTGVGPEVVYEIERETVIGRSMRADLQIEGDLVSRQHARFHLSDGAWHLEDLGSRNGSLVNKRPTTKRRLRSGDVIMIGSAAILFETMHQPSSSFEVSIVAGHANLASATVADGDDDSGMATQALSYNDLILVNDRMATIVRVSQKLATLLDRDQLLGEVLDSLLEHFPQAHRGAVVLKDETDMFQVVATTQRDQGLTTASVMRISTALIQFVRRERKAVLSADTSHDDRFMGSESIAGATGRSIMCAPLQHRDEFLGVIYLDTETLRNPFNHSDLNLLQGIAGPVAIFVENTLLVRQIEHETKMRTSLSRYLSPDVVQQIGEGQLAANLGGEQVAGTVMFSDIVGFTAMSELLAPSEVVERLNQYFTSMLQAIFGWEGTVDKFGGDAILAVWGAPLPMAEHALMATAAALDMQVRLFELNLVLDAAGETRIAMAVGLNTGRFVAGNIGGEDRIEWTVIGDAVNLAQRVESQGFPGCVLASSTTVEGLDRAAGGSVFPPVHVKNRAEPVTIHSVRALRTPQGVVAAVPVTVNVDDGSSIAGIIAKVHPRERLRLTLTVAGDPSPRRSVEIVARLPEGGAPLVAKGVIGSRAPLLRAPAGTSIDVDVAEIEPVFDQMLRAAGFAPAAKSLAEIER